MDIFESLENLNVSEECFEDIVGLVEEYIQEKSDWTVKRWKEAAQNSIKGRKAARESNWDDYYQFTGKLPSASQKKLEKETDERDKYHSDRVARAEYLSKNLPDSNISASKVKSAAEKSANTREKKAEELFNKYVEKGRKQIPTMNRYSEEGNEEEYGKLVRKNNERAKNYNVTYGKEKHAKILANKPLLNDKDKPEAGNYSKNSLSYKDERKERLKDVEAASKNFDKVWAEHSGKVGDDEFDPHRDEIQKADRALTAAKKNLKQHTLSHKV